jgi:hypothetical protein
MILENTIEASRKAIEVHTGVASLVARRYVTNSIPAP